MPECGEPISVLTQPVRLEIPDQDGGPGMTVRINRDLVLADGGACVRQEHIYSPWHTDGRGTWWRGSVG